MKRKSRTFTVATAIEIQQDQLRDWVPRLSGPCLLALQREIKRRNKAIHAKRGATGFDVFRGTDLHDFIANWKPQ